MCGLDLAFKLIDILILLQFVLFPDPEALLNYPQMLVHDSIWGISETRGLPPIQIAHDSVILIFPGMPNFIIDLNYMARV